MNKFGISFFVAGLLFIGQVFGQCPGCIPVDCSAQFPGGGICDSALPTGMVNQPYDERISFYMPTNVTDPGTGFNVELRRIQITGVTGLPIGIDWESDKSGSNDTYRPNNGDNFGCVRYCGSSIQAGTFNITVYLLADVYVPAIGQQVNNQSQTYQTRVTFLPDTSGAGGPATFTINPPQYTSCDSLDLTFTGLIDGAPNPTDYYWDFATGNSAVLGQRTEQALFTGPGTYKVRLNTVINNFVLDVFQIQNTNGNYAGDIEEATTIQNPDLYFTIPSLGYRSSSGSNSRSRTWTGLGIVIPQGTDTLIVQVWDEDNGPPLGSNDDFLGEAKLILSQLGTNFWYDVNGTSTNGLSVVTKTPGTIIRDSFDLIIDSIPEVPGILASDDTFCAGDSVVLSIPGQGANFIKWYKDSVEIPLATDSFLVVYDEGQYSVELITPLGCSSGLSDTATFVKRFPAPPGNVSLVYQQGQLIVSNYNPAFQVRWYLDSVEIPGQTGQFLDVNQTGVYRAEMYNARCNSFSSNFPVTSTGLISVGNENSIHFYAYPNPADEKLNIQWEEVLDGEAVIEMFNTTGQLIQQLPASVGQQNISIDLHDYDAGLYLIRIVSEGKVLGQTRVIKQ
jgi:hypothetical protein